MKKIFLLLAVVALASCVKENGLEPQVNAEGQITISAVAAESKTHLDGLNVLWDADDAIAVVVKGEATEASVAEFKLTGEANSANADFVGRVPSDFEFTNAFAVYPYASVSNEGGVIKVSHTLPEVQTGVVTPGMNLSSALLSVEELEARQATAEFNNALALLQVVVPAGVKEVTLTSANDGLVGTTKFNVNNGLLTRASTGTPRTVKLAAEAGLEARTYPVLVYPGNAGSLSLKMTGTDNAVYESTVQSVTFKAGEARKIDLTQIFKIDYQEKYVVFPTGGTFEVPVVTTDHYQYEVSCAEDWVTYEVPTRGFHKETITFTVAQNTTGADREAEVTITWGEGETAQSKTFKIVQKNIFTEFLNDENDEPIQWEETFSIYSTQESAVAGTGAQKTYKNVFTIALSDDYSKGTYKVSGMLAFTTIYSQKVAPTYYAEYNEGKLIINKNNDGFYLQSDVVLNYNKDSKEFLMQDPVEFTARYDIDGWQNKKGFLYGYSAKVKVEEPAGPSGPSVELGDAVKVLGNTYVESYSLSGAYGNTPGNLVFEESDDLSKGNVIITRIFGCAATGMYATVSGNTITTIESASIEYLQGDAPIGQLTLTIGSDGNITMEDQPLYSQYYLEGYVATKQGGAAEPEVPADPIPGTWNVECEYAEFSFFGSPSYSPMSTTMVIENGSSEGEYVFKVIFGQEVEAGYEVYASFSDNQLTTTATDRFPSMTFVYANGQLTCDLVEFPYQAYYRNIVATK